MQSECKKNRTGELLYGFSALEKGGLFYFDPIGILTR